PEVRNITAIEAEAGRYRRLAEARGLEPGPIVIDYLNLIRGPDNLSAYERISLITARLKELALRLHVPVILLAQLSRAVEQREDKRPVLSDLRDSSSIEQDADNILFLYRDAYYAEREKPADSAPEDKHQAWSARVAKAADTLEIILAKVRSGETSTVRVGVDLANNHFWDLGRSA
ncbi:MAG: DnaB-like helicase C-terminal domain-containing protein, partial [Pseudomonadota bacterium]